MLLVGVGGALGALTRFQFGQMISKKANTGFPFATFIINVSGALLLGFITNATLNSQASLFFCNGFLGAFTTFSTFMYEGFTLFKNQKVNAFIYIAASLFLGMIGYLIGFKIATFM